MKKDKLIYRSIPVKIEKCAWINCLKRVVHWVIWLFLVDLIDCSSTWVKSHVHVFMLVRDRQSCGWFWVWFGLPLWVTRLDQVDNITCVRIWASLDWHSSLFFDTFEGKSTIIMFSRTCLRSLLKLHENCLIRKW